MSEKSQHAQQIIDTALILNQRDLNHGMSGNVSTRDPQGMLITPSGVAYEDMRPDDIVLLGDDGQYQGPKRPSSEWRFHRDIYRARPDVQAIIHTHSRHATTLACLNKDLPAFHYMIAIAGGDVVKCAPYALFGSQALSDYVIQALENRKACLLGHHGLIVAAEDLSSALAITEEIESLCAQYLTLLTITPTPTLLSADQMAEVIEKFKGYGKNAQNFKE